MASIRKRVQRSGATSYSVLWRDADTGRQASMTFPDEQSATNFRRIVQANGNRLAPAVAVANAVAARSPLLAAVLASHIEGLAGVTARTRSDYRRDAARHIVPHLGHVPVAALTVDQVRGWLRTLERGELADKTIRNVHDLLSSALRGAVEAGLRADNPARGVRLTRRRAHERVEMTCLTPAEWHAIDAAVAEFDNGCYRLALRTLAGTGMRWGEMAALRVGDLNLDATPANVRITRAVKRDERSRSYVGPTKTRAGVRTVSIGDVLARQLREHVKNKPLDALLFTSPQGCMLNAGHARARVWIRAVAAAGIGRMPRIHDLRHSHASWLIADGVDLLTVQRHLGHESITTTIGTYGHLLPGQQRAAAEAIDRVLR